MLERRRPESCLSDLVLDELRLGELVPQSPAATAARAHIGDCSLCQHRLRLCTEALPPALSSDEIWQRHRAAVRGSRPMTSRPWPRWWLAAPTAALALGVFAFWVRSGQQADGERRKGAAWSLIAIARHPSGRVERLGPGARLSPGDQLRFEARGDQAGPRHLAIISFDQAGAVTPFIPARGNTVAVGAGKHLLDGSVVLDGVLGAERIMYLACPSPRPIDEVVAAGRAALARARGDLAGVGDLGVGCEQTSFWIEKVKRP